MMSSTGLHDTQQFAENFKGNNGAPVNQAMCIKLIDFAIILH